MLINLPMIEYQSDEQQFDDKRSIHKKAIKTGFLDPNSVILLFPIGERTTRVFLDIGEEVDVAVPVLELSKKISKAQAASWGVMYSSS